MNVRGPLPIPLVLGCMGLLLAVAGTCAFAAEAADGEPAIAVDLAPAISDDERAHWAYQPPRVTEPPTVRDAAWNRHPIDRFWKAALEAKGIAPLPTAGKATLLRRLTYDLTGLPPAPEEVRAFLADDSPDAYERLVDRLLALPAYGERWGQHWLDVARFAETDGFEHDLVRPQAWRYRDWVIDALNADLPFDQFLQWQLAGDQLHPDDPQAAVATGFLLCGPDMPDLNLPEERRHVVLNEMTSTVASVFLGLQFGCAQCHDHKYDAIRQVDFYRLRAFFESTDIFRDHAIPSPQQRAQRQAAEAAIEPRFIEAGERQRTLEAAGRARFRQKNPDEQPTRKQALAELTAEEQQAHAEAVALVKQTPPLPELPQGRVVREGAARPAHFYLRGDFRQVGTEVRPTFPGVLAPVTDEPSIDIQPRVRLAAWLTAPDHPLTARVMVNRLWQGHFGLGLVETASDFGVMGSPPTHAELLDWLALRFQHDGWSLKALHRLMVTSLAYRTASSPYDSQWSVTEQQQAAERWTQAMRLDPENQLGWHGKRQRLEGEAIRDAALAASGRLSSRRGGPGIRPPLAPEVARVLLKDQWVVNGDAEDHRRRSIYLFARRNLRFPLFDVFDRPDSNASCAVRHRSTTATQSLMLFNSAFSLQAARWLAESVLDGSGLTGTVLEEKASAPAEIPPAQAAIQAIYLRLLSRPATEEELEQGATFLARQRSLLENSGRSPDDLALPDPPAWPHDPWAAAALVDFCLALLNSNEFVHID